MSNVGKNEDEFLFVFSHFIHKEDQKSGLERDSLKRGIDESKQTVSRLPTNREKYHYWPFSFGKDSFPN